MKAENQINSGFAGQFGQLFDIFELACPHYRRFERLVAEQVPPGQPVLDLGAGDGVTSLNLLELRAETTVTAVDIETDMLAKAAVRLAAYSGRVRFITAGALDYLQGVPDDSQPVIMSGWCLHNCPRDYRQAVMREIARVLEPGGLFASVEKLALDDFQAHRKTLWDQIGAFAVFDLTDTPRLREEWTMHYLQDDLDRFSEAELRSYAAFGFQDPKIIERVCMDVVYVLRKPLAIHPPPP